MKEWKRRNYKFWHSPLALGVIFCLLVYFGYRVFDLVKKEMETESQKNYVLDKKSELEKKQILLEGELSKLQTEEGKEEVIRDKYQVAKPGEKVVVLVGNDNNQNPGGEVGGEQHGFWNWIKRLFSK